MALKDRVQAIGRWWSAARPGEVIPAAVDEPIHVPVPSPPLDDVVAVPVPASEPEDVAAAEEDAPDELLVTEVALAEVGLPLANRLAALDALEIQARGHDLPLPTGPALRSHVATLQGRLWVAGNPDKPIGWALLDWTADAEVGRVYGVVHPKHRDGEASALLFEALLAAASEQGLAELCAEAYDESAARAWLGRRGFTETVTPPYAVRRLDLARTFERRRRVTEDSLIYGADYQLVRVLAEPVDGRVEMAVHARLIATGEEAGRATLVVSDDAPEHASDGATWVLGPHRGHRLGLLMKSELLTWLESERPRVRALHARTPLDDPHLVALSDRLGSRVVGIKRELRRPV